MRNQKNKRVLIDPRNEKDVLFNIDEIKNHNSLLNKYNPFPVEEFPFDIQLIIQETNSKLKFPEDYMAASILFASSIAIGNTFKIRMQNGWDQIASLFIAIIGRAGANKSHPLKFALGPLYRRDTIAYSEYEKAKIKYDRDITLNLKERLEEGIEEPIKPVFKKNLVSDVTPEALKNVHKNNKRGIGLFMDELIAWVHNFNRYNGGGEQEFWNSVWSGQTSDVDRKNSESIMITDPFVSVGGTIQPGILKGLAQNDRDKNGFLERILMVMPKGVKKEVWSDEDLDIKHIENWDAIVQRILDIELNLDEYDTPISRAITFDPKAREFLNKWQALNTELVNTLPDKSIEGFYIKLESYCIRFCLILHVLQRVCDNEERFISINTVIGAIKLTEYFRINAVRVNELLTNRCPLDILPKNKVDFYESLPETFQTKQAIEKGKSFDLEERNIKRLLAKKELFQRIKTGFYEKLL